MIEDLSREAVADILVGATFYGAGGGGELAEGFDLLDMALAAGRRFRMAALADIPDHALLCTPYLLGAISDLPTGEAALVGGQTHPIMVAFDTLSAHLDAPVFGTIPCELGGSNTAVAFFVAAMADAVVVDADPTGRAVPEITHSAYALAGLPASPIFLANAAGETMILDHIADDARAEAVVRALAQVSQNDIAAIDHAMPASDLQTGLLPGTLSRSGRLGALWRQAKAAPATLPAKIAAAAGGRVIFEGQVTNSRVKTRDGFTLGRFEVSGHGAFEGQTFAVDLKNENMVGWLDGIPAVTVPEIITVLDLDTGEVVTNPNVRTRQAVSILVLPAPDVFLTPAGLATFGPRYAGVDQPFRSAL